MASKKERIDKKIAGGLPRIAAEIAVVKEDAKAKIEVLKMQQEMEDRKAASRIVALLKKEHPAIHKELIERVRKGASARASTQSKPTKRANSAPTKA